MTKLEFEIQRLREAGRTSIKALSIRQPWAWLILWAGKDIENRSRRFHFRGRFLIHASAGMTRNEYLRCCCSFSSVAYRYLMGWSSRT